jgi:hypothetical protein
MSIWFWSSCIRKSKWRIKWITTVHNFSLIGYYTRLLRISYCKRVIPEPRFLRDSTFFWNLLWNCHLFFFFQSFKSILPPKQLLFGQLYNHFIRSPFNSDCHYYITKRFQLSRYGAADATWNFKNKINWIHRINGITYDLQIEVSGDLKQPFQRWKYARHHNWLSTFMWIWAILVKSEIFSGGFYRNTISFLLMSSILSSIHLTLQGISDMLPMNYSLWCHFFC